ncbi:MAG: phytanoyl-CoA dioxygenase family protein [Chitinophagales bacterium]|jgi:hypothetical protein|nr:phytanoyl-CoA dioxygenase family protein [Chitinophagales bacterium]
MIPVLKDSELEAQLAKEGFVVLPFLNETEVAYLVDLYNTHHTDSKEGLYATAHSSDRDFKMKLNVEILKQFERAIEHYFLNCRPLGGSYITKYKGQNGSLLPHQDWSIVDEEQFRSFNIWIPLVDTTEENGAICVLPHSHTLLKSFRGVNVPDPFYKISDYTWKYHQTLNMKAGEALLYDHRLLHASGINQTEQPRLAVVFGIIPEKAEMRYHFIENGVISEYESNLDFFFNFDILKGPQGLKKLRDLEYTVNPLTEEDFDYLYLGIEKKKSTPIEAPVAQPLTPSTEGLWGKLKRLFS